MGHGDEKRFERLAAERAPGVVAEGGREHDRHFAPCCQHGFLCGIDGRLSVECIEDGLDEQCVDASFQECRHLLGVGVGEFVEGDGASRWVGDVGAHGERLVGGADGADHEADWSRRLVGSLTCKACGSEVDLADEVLTGIVGEGNPLGVETVGLDDVGARSQIAAVDVEDEVRAGETEQVVVACLLSGQIVPASEVLFGESVGLEQGAHCSVEDKGSAAGKGITERGGCWGHDGKGVGSVIVLEGGCGRAASYKAARRRRFRSCA